MAQRKFLNRTAGVTLAAALAADGTAAKVAPGLGALYPPLTGGAYYVLTLATAGAPEVAEERVKSTGFDGTALVLTQRGVDSEPRAWRAGDKCECRMEANYLNTVADMVATVPSFPKTPEGFTTGVLLETGALATLGRPRKVSGGGVISYNDGARGEAVLAESTPASGGSNGPSVDPGGRVGTPTRRVFCATDATNGTVRYNAPAGKSFGRMTSQDSILVLMFIAACNSADTLQVTISADNMAQGASATIGLNVGKAYVDRTYNAGSGYWWQVIDASAFVGGTALPANINSIRAKVTRSGAVATDVHILGVLKSVRHRPTVIIDFDDQFLSQYTHAFQTMSQYGLVGNVGVIAQMVGKSAGQAGGDTYDYCSLRQLQDMRDAGWGMATHGYYPHNQAGTMNSYANIKADVQMNRDYVLANLASPSNLHYILPAGQQHASTDQALAELGFITSRGTIGQQTVESPLGVDNPYRLFGTPISASAGLADMKAKFDFARKNGTTIRMQGHRIVSAVTDPGNEILDTDWDAFCAYIAPAVASGEVLNLTLAEWNAVRLR